MARHTDVAFRQVCKEQGADVMVTEFVQSEALIRDNAKAWEMVDFTETQRPMGVQIFGATPASMAKAARMVCDRMKPDFLDLNFGCPAHKVIEQNAGSGLLRCPPLLYDLVKAVKDSIPDVPLTAKMRIGWDYSTIVAVEVAGRLEELGVEAIAVHGRTKEQGYSGVAHWGWIAQVAAAVKIPVIGNGDVKDGASALLRQREAGVSGLMIGRAALGNPWIFGQIKAALAGLADDLPLIGTTQRWDCMLRLAELTIEVHSSRLGSRDVRWMLDRLHPLTHGLPGSRKLRDQLRHCLTLDDLRRLRDAHLSEIVT
ncbi:MAG: tRNA-dihydrouridine synthase family protein [Verrucomicrobia bacterium]|nr:tRNA-dihydrouridine synthase family protein [Verrucomicrobiota bacterium]NBS04840.1 tRNA-dihydrouridine synthase family protein [Verrucomicrobiota bacterium]NBY36571.1 tRNA-dihydrouridine synthase family protein [Verrucomicrobiota bacterium]